MTDNAFLLTVLSDGKWHSNTEILTASLEERGCGLTVHSRASDLRKRGYVIETNTKRPANRRVAFYRLVGTLSETSGVGNGNKSLPPLPSEVSLSASIPAGSDAATEDAHTAVGGALTLFACERKGRS